MKEDLESVRAIVENRPVGELLNFVESRVYPAPKHKTLRYFKVLRTYAEVALAVFDFATYIRSKDA